MYKFTFTCIFLCRKFVSMSTFTIRSFYSSIWNFDFNQSNLSCFCTWNFTWVWVLYYSQDNTQCDIHNSAHTVFPRVLCQHSCYPVVHFCSNWQTLLYSCISSTRQGVAAGVFVLCVLLNCRECACIWNIDALCPFSLSLCKHVLAKHALTLGLTQTQSPVQESSTAALNYVNYHGQKTHTLSGHWLQP